MGAGSEEWIIVWTEGLAEDEEGLGGDDTVGSKVDVVAADGKEDVADDLVGVEVEAFDEEAADVDVGAIEIDAMLDDVELDGGAASVTTCVELVGFNVVGRARGTATCSRETSASPS